jgi:hypothetical protein
MQRLLLVLMICVAARAQVSTSGGCELSEGATTCGSHKISPGITPLDIVDVGRPSEQSGGTVELPNSPGYERHCYTNTEAKTMIEIACDQVPKVSKVRDWAPIVVIPPKHTSFWEGSKYPEAIRSNHEVFHSKSFIALNVGIWASVGANLARNWGNYKHDQPHGGELLLDDMLPAAVNSAMVWGSYRFIWAPIGVGTAGYGIYRNTESTISGVYF